MQNNKHKRVYEDVSEQIQALLRSQNLQSGDRLPPERQMAELFRVSRNSVREAIKILEQQGVLSSRPGAGTFIVDPSALSRELQTVMIRERHRLADIFELRLLLEPQIARLAAERINPHDIDALEEFIELQKNAPTPQQALDHDLAFHQCIAAATGNQAVVQLMDHLHDLLAESRDEALQSSNRRHHSLEGHRAIRAALISQDPLACAEAMAKHLQYMQEHFFEPNENEV